MTKDKPKINTRQREVLNTPSVGLSYCPQSRRFYLQIMRYINGECKLKHKEIRLKNASELLNEKFDVPRRSGQVFQSGLTNKAKGKIRFVARLFQFIVLSNLTKKPYCSFITLTYGLHYPTDHEAKKHLEAFIKRKKRQHPHFQYIWVAEKQKRGAIHFHLLTPNFIDKKLINKAWNGIVSKWQKRGAEYGRKQQEVYPNVCKVDHAGKYMTKYLQKEAENIGGNMYGIDMLTRSMMEAEITTIESDESLNDITEHLPHVIKSKDGISFSSKDFNNNHQEWISELNEFALKEFLQYTIPELNLTLHESQKRPQNR